MQKATAFIQQTGNQLVAIVNGTQSAAQKRQAIAQILETAVDVDGIARFCLGRFWRTASPDQQQRYVAAFHEVLVTNISSKLGEYQGVKLTVQRGRQQDDEAIVTTEVDRPNNPPTTVDWVVENPTTTPKIVDVLAEGTSLRLTQRQDYASYLTRNNNRRERIDQCDESADCEKRVVAHCRAVPGRETLLHVPGDIWLPASINNLATR